MASLPPVEPGELDAVGDEPHGDAVALGHELGDGTGDGDAAVRVPHAGELTEAQERAGPPPPLLVLVVHAVVGHHDLQTEQPRQRHPHGRADGVDVHDVGATDARQEHRQQAVDRCFVALHLRGPDPAEPDAPPGARAVLGHVRCPDDHLDIAAELHQAGVEVLGVGLDAALHVGEAAQPEDQHAQASIRSTRVALAIGPGLVRVASVRQDGVLARPRRSHHSGSEQRQGEHATDSSPRTHGFFPPVRPPCRPSYGLHRAANLL